ncbi:MAG: hypothetical protein R3E87_17465 [Burkholderiaceae bacterium]
MNEASGPERDGLSSSAIAAGIGAALLILLLGAGAMWFLYPGARDSGDFRRTVFAPPRLLKAPVADYRAWHEEQRARLAGQDGRMPIERAMATVSAAGAAGFDPEPPR